MDKDGSKTPDDFLDDAAELFRERNAVYGANYKRAGECLNALFPDGIVLETADDQSRYHILMLIIVKLSRYAVNWECGHEDSVDDLITYAAMLKKMDVNAGLYGEAAVPNKEGEREVALPVRAVLSSEQDDEAGVPLTFEQSNGGA